MPISSVRKFAVIFFSTYFGVLALIIATTAGAGELTRDNVGIALLFIGSAVFVLPFLFMGAANRGDGSTRSPHIRSDTHFKEWRKQERPLESVIWAIILAGALLAGTGYALLYLINFG